jgi:malate dehydrogenase
MQRSDLILDNAHIFCDQGKIINKVSKKSVKIIVVGNPANTNALIVCSNTPDIPNENISSLMRLDQNRAKSILSSKVGQHVSSVTKLVVWGNHSTTQYPDISHAQINNSNNFLDTIDEHWIHDDFIPRVQKRGAEIIEHRGLSSAASAASAVYDHFNVLVNGSDDWESMGILTSNNYSITSNLFYSLPLKISKNSFDVIESIEVSEKMRTYLSATEKELIDERDTVKKFL